MSVRTFFRRSPILLLFAAAVIAVGAVACSGDDDDATPAATNTPAASTGAAAPTATTAAAAEPTATSAPAPTTAPTEPADTATPEATGVTVSTGEGDLGEYLVGPNGHTLYVFLRDAADTSNCVDNCLDVWPPLLLKSGESVEAGEGVEGSFGTIETTAGTQVTYNQAPLYYFASDAAEGDTSGNLVGGVWFVARPETASTNFVGFDEEDGYLVGPTGMTLYFFANDTDGVSNCSGGCLQNWPALTAPEGLDPTATAGADGTVATLTRADDGKLQITYNGKPLYYFAGDSLPGETKGDGVGGVWSIATP